ncbi:MAG TPA: aromatic amino acid transport family protein, partial [Waddliaceae bacterium]
MTKQSGSLFGAILLVAGTAIGGGMLALPVLTSLGGFIPSLIIFFLCWLFMACTGLLFLEVCQWTEKGSNIISMAEKTLGPFGKVFAWGIYLFLFYCLTLAYIVGCGNLVSQAFQIPDWSGPLLFVAVFSPVVFAGARVTGKINILCMLGLGIFYCAFVLLGYRYIKTELLLERNWPLSLMALPIAFASFGYQGIVPTLYEYLSHDFKKTRIAIIIGSSIPLATYIVWQWLILGVVPTYGP